MQDKKGRELKTIIRVFDIIESILELEDPTLSELAEAMDMAKSTIHSYLNTLENQEYLVKENDAYRLSLRFLDFGTRTKQWWDIVGAAQNHLEDLAEETGEVAWLIVEEWGYGVFLSRAIGHHGVPTHGWIGKRTYLHTTSAGKAIMANLSEEKLDRIIDQHGLPQVTSQTITDRARLEDDLAEIRERGFALNRSEIVEGHHGVSSVIICEDEVIGAVGIAGPAHRLSGETFREDIPQIVLGAANAIELEMTYPQT